MASQADLEEALKKYLPSAKKGDTRKGYSNLEIHWQGEASIIPMNNNTVAVGHVTGGSL